MNLHGKVQPSGILRVLILADWDRAGLPCPHLPEATRSDGMQLILRHGSHFNFFGSAVFDQWSLQVKATANEAVVICRNLSMDVRQLGWS